MGLALLAIIWLITFVSTYFFVAKTWWLPHGASTAAALDRPSVRADLRAHGNCFRGRARRAGLVRVAISRSRNRHQGHVLPRQHQAGSALDGAHCHPLYWAEPHGQPDLGVASALRRRRPARFRWKSPACSLPGTSAIPERTENSARTDPKLMDPSAGNEAALGLDTADPASKDDVVTGTMYLPGEPPGGS